MIVDLLLFSVEKNVFPSKVGLYHVTTMRRRAEAVTRRPDVSRGVQMCGGRGRLPFVYTEEGKLAFEM